MRYAGHGGRIHGLYGRGVFHSVVAFHGQCAVILRVDLESVGFVSEGALGGNWMLLYSRIYHRKSRVWLSIRYLNLRVNLLRIRLIGVLSLAKYGFNDPTAIFIPFAACLRFQDGIQICDFDIDLVSVVETSDNILCTIIYFYQFFTFLLGHYLLLFLLQQLLIRFCHYFRPHHLFLIIGLVFYGPVVLSSWLLLGHDMAVWRHHEARTLKPRGLKRRDDLA